MAFAIAAEIERDLISMRTTEALQVRKEQSMTLGCPNGIDKSKLDKYRTEIEASLKNGATKTWIANKYQSTIGWARILAEIGLLILYIDRVVRSTCMRR